MRPQPSRSSSSGGRTSDMRTETLVVGAGVSGLAFAEALGDADYVLVDAADEVGGYCRSVHRDGFVWDYAGHFFHFRHPEVEEELIRRIGPSRVRKVARRSKVLYKDRLIDFPFQRHIDQLDHDDFVACLNGLGTRDTAEPQELQGDALRALRRRIAEKFLIPYNEKLYATDLGDARQRRDGALLPARRPDRHHPEHAGRRQRRPTTRRSPIRRAARSSTSRRSRSAVRTGRSRLSEPLVGIDLERRSRAPTRARSSFERLVSLGALPTAARARAGCPHDPAVFTWNKVLVFNLGFDRKGPRTSTGSTTRTARVASTASASTTTSSTHDRMSLYVEIGCRPTSRSPGSTWPRERACWPTWSARASSTASISWRPTTSCWIPPTCTSPAPRRRMPRRSGPRWPPMASTPSAATAAGPTARSRTTSSRPARWRTRSTARPVLPRDALASLEPDGNQGLTGIRSRWPTRILSGSLIFGLAATTCATVVRV